MRAKDGSKFTTMVSGEQSAMTSSIMSMPQLPVFSLDLGKIGVHYYVSAILSLLRLICYHISHRNPILNR